MLTSKGTTREKRQEGQSPRTAPPLAGQGTLEARGVINPKPHTQMSETVGGQEGRRSSSPVPWPSGSNPRREGENAQSSGAQEREHEPHTQV